MTEAEALDKAVRLTGYARYRELLDPAHPDHDRRFWPIVWAIAAGYEPPRPPVKLVMSVQRRSKLCPHYRPCETGCGGPSCMEPGNHVDPWRDCGNCLYLPD